MSVYTKPGKHPSDTISCQSNFITSTIFVVFFAYFSKQSINFLLSKRGFGALCIGLRCLH